MLLYIYMNLNKNTKKMVMNALLIILVILLILKFVKKEYFSIGGTNNKIGVETINKTIGNAPSINNSNNPFAI